MQAAVSIVDGVDWSDRAEYFSRTPEMNEQRGEESVPPTLDEVVTPQVPTVRRDSTSLSKPARAATLNGENRV